MIARNRLGFSALLMAIGTSIFVACSDSKDTSGGGTPAKAWQCAVVGSACVCADTASSQSVDGSSASCPQNFTCCGIDTAPNESGVTQCLCLVGGGTCDVSAGKKSIAACPP